MECPKCKWNNDDNAVRCANCFTELTPNQRPPDNTQVFQPQQPQQPQQPPQSPYGQPQQPQTPQQPYGQPAGQPYNGGQSVSNYLVWSIISLVLSVLCCNLLALPFSIVALVKSVGVNNALLNADQYRAASDSGAAKTWNIVATILLVLGLILNVVLLSSGFMQGFNEAMKAGQTYH